MDTLDTPDAIDIATFLPSGASILSRVEPWTALLCLVIPGFDVSTIPHNRDTGYTAEVCPGSFKYPEFVAVTAAVSNQRCLAIGATKWVFDVCHVLADNAGAPACWVGLHPGKEPTQAFTAQQVSLAMGSRIL